MIDKLPQQASEKSESKDFRDLSHLERYAILMDGRLRALAERAIAAKAPSGRAGGDDSPIAMSSATPYDNAYTGMSAP
jgi:hypothetical protein